MQSKSLVKIHVGCGTVYLTGWQNIDLPGPHVWLASERPDLVGLYSTTDADYYRKHKQETIKSLRIPRHSEYVCDHYGTFAFIPCRSGQANELLARHSFEHLSISEAKLALREINRVLCVKGVLRIDVPDHEETLKLLLKTNDPFYIRHLLGPRRGDYGFHMMSYTPARLRNLVRSYGFRYVGKEKNIHLYPAFCLRFEKAMDLTKDG